ncbi:MAG: hypothetical protein R3B47_13735 [Bacteroidia bacterium]
MFIPLHPPANPAPRKLVACSNKLQALLNAIAEKEIGPDTVLTINREIEQVNAAADLDERAHKKAHTRAYNRISNLVRKEYSYVGKGYNMALWMSIGMSAFGIPFGMAFGLAMDNMGLMGMGIGFGLAIGLAIGAGLDEKAKKEGKQLNMGKA